MTSPRQRSAPHLVVPLPVMESRPKLAPDDVPTMVPCPWCSGIGCVSVAKRSEWISVYPELARTP